MHALTAAMAFARRASTVFGLLSPLLVLLLVSGVACESDAVDDVNFNCDLISGAKEVDGECVCENPDDFFDGSYTKCISVAFDGILTECEENRQCSLRMGQGAQCKNGVCACADNFHYMHGTCWLTKSYGESCKEDAECFAYAESDAYACVEGVCGCAKEALTLRPGDNPICRRIAQASEECESDVECVEGYICKKVTRPTTSLNYVCSKGSRKNSASQQTSFAAVNETRWREVSQRSQSRPPAAEVDESPCGENEELTPSGAACVCKRGFFKPTATSSCLPELGEPCWKGVDDKNPHILYGTCRRSAKFLLDSSDRDPSTPDGVWACLGGFVADPQNRICEKTRKVTFNCLIDSQCAYYGGYCSNKKCRCEEGQQYDSEKLVCWIIKGLGEECEVDSDCGVATEGSVECSGGTCQCKASYHPMNDDCRKDTYAIGDECTETSDCVFAVDDPTIICDKNICSCDAGYFPLDDTSCQVGINGTCQSNSDCNAVPYSKCVEDKCVCIDGYVRASTSKCIQVANDYGSECEENEQCTYLTVDGENISCSSETNTCVCEEDHHYQNQRCWSSRSLKQKCNYASECIAENAICKNNYCTCDFGYIPDGDKSCKENAAPHALSGSFMLLAFITLASRLL